jgi:hypothetical protein
VQGKSRIATRRVALGAVLVDQLALGHRFAYGLDRNNGRKAFLKTA